VSVITLHLVHPFSNPVKVFRIVRAVTRERNLMVDCSYGAADGKRLSGIGAPELLRFK